MGSREVGISQPVAYTDGLQAGWPEFDSRQDKIFLFSTAESRNYIQNVSWKNPTEETNTDR
jgi:hypothetical protein